MTFVHYDVIMTFSAAANKRFFEVFGRDRPHPRGDVARRSIGLVETSADSSIAVVSVLPNDVKLGAPIFVRRSLDETAVRLKTQNTNKQKMAPSKGWGWVLFAQVGAENKFVCIPCVLKLLDELAAAADRRRGQNDVDNIGPILRDSAYVTAQCALNSAECKQWVESDKVTALARSITNIEIHLQGKHRLLVVGDAKFQTKESVERMFPLARLPPRVREWFEQQAVQPRLDEPRTYAEQIKDCFVRGIACKYIAYSVVDGNPGFDEMFRHCQIKGGKIDRRFVSTRTVELARDEEAKFFEHYKALPLQRRVGTLAVDSGTVYGRWVAFMLHLPGMPPVVVDMVLDVDVAKRAKDYEAAVVRRRAQAAAAALPGAAAAAAAAAAPPAADDDGDAGGVLEERAALVGRLTSPNLQWCTGSIVAGLRVHGVFVICVTTDNAANMTSMADRVTAFAGRCFVHGLQLLVRIMFENDATLSGAWTMCVNYIDAVGKFTGDFETKKKLERSFARFVPTRWDSQIKTMQTVNDMLTAPEGSEKHALLQRLLAGQPPAPAGQRAYARPHRVGQIADAIRDLDPWFKATYHCASNAVDMISAFEGLRMIGILAPLFEQNRRHYFAPLVDKFRERMLSVPFVLTAYFSPFKLADIAGEGAAQDAQLLSVTVKRWLATETVRELCSFLRVPNATIAQEFDAIERQAKPPFQCTRVGCGQYLDWLSREAPSLGAVVKCVVGCAPSEASAERAFRRLKLLRTSDRKSLSAQSTTAQLKLNVFAAERKFRTVVHAVDADAADAIVVADDAAPPAAAVAADPADDDDDDILNLLGLDDRAAAADPAVDLVAEIKFVIAQAVVRIKSFRTKAQGANKCGKCAGNLPRNDAASVATCRTCGCGIHHSPAKSCTDVPLHIAAEDVVVKCTDCETNATRQIWW